MCLQCKLRRGRSRKGTGRAGRASTAEGGAGACVNFVSVCNAGGADFVCSPDQYFSTWVREVGVGSGGGGGGGKVVPEGQVGQAEQLGRVRRGEAGEF